MGLPRIQIKEYTKTYTKLGRKRSYRPTVYYVYIPRRLAESLLEKDLRFVWRQNGFSVEQFVDQVKSAK